MEVYADHMIVKSKTKEGHVSDLRECFKNLRAHKMRLNPSKCTCGFSSDKFLGFLITQRGIEANPERIQAILQMPAPTKHKDVQKLTRCLAALIRFVSKLAERCFPFFQTLKGAQNSRNFSWSPKC